MARSLNTASGRVGGANGGRARTLGGHLSRVYKLELPLRSREWHETISFRERMIYISEKKKITLAADIELLFIYLVFKFICRVD